MAGKYVNFEIEVQSRNGDGLPLVVRSPFGQASSVLHPPTRDAEYRNLIARLYALDEDTTIPTQIGRTLFRALFHDSINDAFLRSRNAIATGQALRLRLQIDDHEAAALPWEFLHDGDEYPLALRNTPILRYIPHPTPRPAQATELPLQILLTSAQTSPQSDVARELNEIQAGLARIGEYVEITVEPNLTRAKLELLLKETFHVWHYVGQVGTDATGKSQLLLESEQHGVDRLSTAELARLLGTSGVQLAILDACNQKQLATPPLNSIASALVHAGVPAVVILQMPSPEKTSRVFYKTFYLALAEGMPIDVCVNEGRKSIWSALHGGCADWGIPSVYTSITNGILFHLPRSLHPDITDTIHTLGGLNRPPTAVSVHTHAGTLLHPAPPLTVRRLENPPRAPRSIRGFLNRDETLDRLIPQIQPGGRAWLSGAPGCGLTSLLRRATITPAVGRLSSGIAYVNGEAEPSSAEDIVQRLFNRFYTSSLPIKAEVDQSYLAKVDALFVLDQLPLRRAEIEHLAQTTLRSGAVLVASSNVAPSSFAGLPIGGLPRRDAIRICAEAGGLDASRPEAQIALNRICERLNDLPLPVLLAGRMMRSIETTPEHFVVSLEAVENMHRPYQVVLESSSTSGERVPRRRLARTAVTTGGPDAALEHIARLTLNSINSHQCAVLAALVRVGGQDATVDAISSISQISVTTVEEVLVSLTERMLVHGHKGRYTIISNSLLRVLDQMLPIGEERRRAAAFFAEAAASNTGDLTWLGAERSNLLAAIELLLSDGNTQDAGTLVRALQPLLVVRGLWGTWARLIDHAEQAAMKSGDQALRGWALHERGTRAGLLGNYEEAETYLLAALHIRRALNDTLGSTASRHNLAFLELLPARTPYSASAIYAARPTIPASINPIYPSVPSAPVEAKMTVVLPDLTTRRLYDTPDPLISEPDEPEDHDAAEQKTLLFTRVRNRRPGLFRRLLVAIIAAVLLISTGFAGTQSLLRSMPTAVAVATPTSGINPLTVTFDATQSTNIDFQSGVRYIWDFGDGSAPTDTSNITITYTYRTIGTFQATLRVRDGSDNFSNTSSVTVNVTNSPPQVRIDLPINDSTFVPGEELTLRGEARDFEDGVYTDNVLTWTMILRTGDQVETLLPPTTGNNLIVTTPTEGIDATSRIEVQLSVTDSLNATTTGTHTLQPELGEGG